VITCSDIKRTEESEDRYNDMLFDESDDIYGSQQCKHQSTISSNETVKTSENRLSEIGMLNQNSSDDSELLEDSGRRNAVTSRQQHIEKPVVDRHVNFAVTENNPRINKT